MPAREAHADLPGVRIWYTDTGGSGVPVVLLHANTGSSRVWDYQTPAFTARGYRVIAYDRRGFGRSIIDPAGVQPGTGADDLLALVNHLGVDRFHLVGTAGGAFVALDFALSFPQRLRSLVVANSIGAVQDEDYLELGRRLRPARSSTRCRRKSGSSDRRTARRTQTGRSAGWSWSASAGRKGRRRRLRRCGTA